MEQVLEEDTSSNSPRKLVSSPRAPRKAKRKGPSVSLSDIRPTRLFDEGNEVGEAGGDKDEGEDEAQGKGSGGRKLAQKKSTQKRMTQKKTPSPTGEKKREGSLHRVL